MDLKTLNITVIFMLLFVLLSSYAITLHLWIKYKSTFSVLIGLCISVGLSLLFAYILVVIISKSRDEIDLNYLSAQKASKIIYGWMVEIFVLCIIGIVYGFWIAKKNHLSNLLGMILPIIITFLCIFSIYVFYIKNLN